MGANAVYPWIGKMLCSRRRFLATSRGKSQYFPGLPVRAACHEQCSGGFVGKRDAKGHQRSRA